MPNYEESYLGRLRKLVGREKMISISARGILQDEQGRVLLVQRNDNGHWVMPAGSIELGESILDCLKREVWEETGLTAVKAELIAIYSDPRFSFVTAYGDPYQMLSHVFLVTVWHGTLASKTDETLDARFFALDKLPPDLPALYAETLADLTEYRKTGQVIVK